MAKDLHLDYQSLFTKAFQNASIGMTIVSLEGKWLKVNPAFCKFLGYTEEELLNKTFHVITHPDDLESDLLNTEKLLEGKIKNYQMEKRYIHKSGEIIWGSLNVSLVHDDQGIPLYFITQIQNITDQKLVESRLESFFKNNADAIWMVDLEDKVLEVNRTFETMFGWKAEEVIGKKLPIIPDSLVDSMRELHNRVRTGESVIGFETVRQRKDRGTFHVSATLSPVRHGDGDIMGISGICRDITEWKKSQEILQQSEKLSVAGQLAAGIAHEIRNPITSIKGFLQLIKTGFGEKKEYLDIMSSEIDRIEMILSELLILAKPQSSKYEHADLPELLEHVITLLGTQGNLHNIRITSKLVGDIPMIECDKNQLKQVFINFIKNSMEAMPNGGEIMIEVHRLADRELRIRFTDQGCGIPEEIMAKLGHPFFTTKEKGTGLGLMISKKIIEDHNGRLHIKSKVNEGTTIELLFPVGMQKVRD